MFNSKRICCNIEWISYKSFTRFLLIFPIYHFCFPASQIDTLTQLLPQCCERLVAVDAVPVLFRLITACNRSEPHVRIITYTLNTLLNVAMVCRIKMRMGNRENKMEEFCRMVVAINRTSMEKFEKERCLQRKGPWWRSQY